MENNFTKNFLPLVLLLLLGAVYSPEVRATQLSGTYTIDSNGVASTTVFKNLQSAITFLTSASARTDGGPANAAPFGISGPVEFVFAANSGPYQNIVTIPAITGSSAANTITINGNGNTLQALGDLNNRAVIVLQGVTYLTIKNLIIKTLDATYGWGIQFKSASNYNIIDSCTIDIGSVTSATAANSAGIVFSSSATTPTTAAANGYFNIISNNLLVGNPTGAGMYYGIVGAPAASGTTVSANKIINNTILNYYSYGIYWAGSNSSLIKRNKIARTTKTSFTTTYGIYLSGASRKDTIEANEITGAFNGTPTSTATFYGIYAINYTGTAAEPNTIFNNIVYNNKGNGSLTGISSLTSYNTRYYNNTISFEHQAATSATAVVTGANFTGTASATNLIDFRNNIFNITQSSIGPKYGLTIASAQTAGITMDKNAYYGTGTTYTAVNYAGVDYTTLLLWQQFATAYDQNSRSYNPLFTDVANGNLSPRDVWFDVSGDVIALVKTYYNGDLRVTPPMGIGAFKGNIPATDVALNEITKPAAPYAAGSYPIGVKIRNAGTNTLTTATINWSVNGVAQTPVPYTGSIAPGTVSAIVPLSSIAVTNNTLYKIDAEVLNPNGLWDSSAANNSATDFTAATVLAGTYSINSGAATGATNFASLKVFADIVNTGGITGAITLNFTPNSGPYNEQVIFTKIPGANALSPITINGNGEYIQFNNTAASIGIVNLIGTDHVTFNQLNVKSLNATYGVGYLFTVAADSNTINNCTIDISSVTGSSTSAGIAVTGSLLSATTSNAFCIANKFINNTITGGPSGGPYYGIALNVNATTNSPDNRYVVANNIIRDFTVYGIYSSSVLGSRFSNNKISRPLKTSASTFYGIYFANNATGDTVENNMIFKPAESNITMTNGVYGIYLTGISAQSARPNIVRNNIITDLKTNGLIYGVYCSSISYTNFLHNTISIDDPASAATGVTYGFYSTTAPTSQVNRNNIFYINRGGTGNKAAIYLNTVSATGYIISNNVYHVKSPVGSTTNYLGYYNSAFVNDLPAWNTAVTFDLNSVSADPMFRSFMVNAPLTPSNDSLNNNGFSTPLAPLDYAGKTRSATPDRGAYEFVVPAVDAGLTKFVSPVISQVMLGNFVNIEVQLKNFGKAGLTSANLNWKVDTSLQTPNTWSGSLSANDTFNATVGSYFVSTPGIFPVKVWTDNPNMVPDSIGDNDTISMVLCTPLSGTVTLNQGLPASSSNFTTFAEFAKVVSNCGVSGDLTLVVSPGIYYEQVSFIGRIAGSGVGARIIIDGGDSALTVVKHDGSVKRATLLLENTSNLVFRNIRFETTGGSAGTAVQLMNNADSNSFTRCTFVAPYSTSTSVNAFIGSGSLTSATTQGTYGHYLLIDSCTAQGGYYCIDLYGSTGMKPMGNTVQNSVVRNAHFYGIYTNYQDAVKIINNKVLNIGVAGNNSGTTIAAISVLNSNNGIAVTGNEIQNMLGGRGIQLVTNLGTPGARIVVANNMVNIGDALFTTYGIYENNNAFTDIAYNTVKLNTAESGYAGAALYTNNSDPVTYNNIRIVNNIFTAPNGSLSVYIVTGANLIPALYTLDHNVYYSTGSYPFRVAGFITTTYAGFVTGTPNMLGTFLPGNNIHGQFFMPKFFSGTNLRSINPELDDSAMVIASVSTDFDGKARSGSTPDIGINEFSKPGADAGVVQILSPSKPMSNGPNDIVVVVKNFGSSTLSTFDVHYRIDTTQHTLTYMGSLLPNAIDTVVFDSLSGPGGTSQRYDFSGNLVSVKSWTANPNGVIDSLNNNDTSFTSICGSLNGTYTIDASGSGPSNFVSLQSAIDKLVCGGISGPVVFNIAPGVYNNQITIPTIAGTTVGNTITFKSANNIASSVTLTTNTGNAAANYTVRLLGARYVRFENLTLTNTDPTYSRILSINKEPSSNVNTAEIIVRGCSFTGSTIASTADQYALVWGPMGDNATYLTFAKNSFTNGSIGISIGGQNIVNQNAPGLIIDSNIFTNQYYASMWIQNRFLTQIRGNDITGHPTYTGYYGIYANGFGTASEISQNRVINPAGSYGIYVGQNSYYDAPGLTFVSNNLVQLLGTGTQYGLYLTNSNKMRYYNNTVRLNTTSTSSYAFYYAGHASFVNGSTTYPASYDVSVVNNILTGVTGYALATSNIQATTGLMDVNHNLYYTGYTTPFSLAAVTYTPAQFNTTYRNAIHAGSDAKSIFGNLVFSSPTSFIPAISNPGAWLVNGRGRHMAAIDKDFAGTPRSTMPFTGVPDIGAYEIAPTSIPASGVFTDSISYGLTQYLIDNADTVASVTWGFSGTLPTSIDGKFFPGSLVSNPAAYAVPAGKTAMDMFVDINANGGSFYSYDVKLYYEPAMLGTVPSETELIGAKRTAGVWSNYPFGQTILDTVLKTFVINGLGEFGEFTGTDAINALPVKLQTFEATPSGNDAMLTWTTASEANLSKFVIERSTDNIHFREIAKVDPAGSVSKAARYSVLDAGVKDLTKANRVYYRLKMVDMDGTTERSAIRIVEFRDATAKRQTLAYPNPFDQTLTLLIPADKSGTSTIEVFDMYGKQVYKTTAEVVKGLNTLTIEELQSLPKGIYYVKLSGLSETEESIKLLKN